MAFSGTILFLRSEKDLLRDLTTLRLQGYVSSLATSPGFQSHESKDKIRDVLSSVLSAAVKYKSLVLNPAAELNLPLAKKGRRAQIQR